MVLPTRPRNHRGYALLAHTLGKMRSCATGERSTTEIRTVELKKYNYTAKLFPVASTSHTVSPRYTFLFACASHTVAPRKTFPFTGTSHTIFPIKSLALLNISHMVRGRNCVAKLSITHSFYVVNVCARWPNANSFQEKVVCDSSLIQHGLFLETVCVA